MTLAELNASINSAEDAACKCDVMIGWTCSNHAAFRAIRVRLKILLSIIRAQSRVMVAYRLMSRAPEKHLDILAKHRDLINEIVKGIK